MCLLCIKCNLGFMVSRLCLLWSGYHSLTRNILEFDNLTLPNAAVVRKQRSSYFSDVHYAQWRSVCTTLCLHSSMRYYFQHVHHLFMMLTFTRKLLYGNIRMRQSSVPQFVLTYSVASRVLTGSLMLYNSAYGDFV